MKRRKKTKLDHYREGFGDALWFTSGIILGTVLTLTIVISILMNSGLIK